jgi:hypothetical protein
MHEINTVTMTVNDTIGLATEGKLADGFNALLG